MDLTGQASGAAAPSGPASSVQAAAAKAEPVKPEPSWGAWVVIAGLAAVVVIFVVAVLHYKTAAEVTTAVGAVSGVIAALVGAYFGIRGATLAQTKVESSSAARERRSGH
jgi:uncharacterized membrane protein YdcZ (DUF606 family)